MSHLCKLCHRKKVLENFQELISKYRYITILIRGTNCHIFNLLVKLNIRFIIKIDSKRNCFVRYPYFYKKKENCHLSVKIMQDVWKKPDLYFYI